MKSFLAKPALLLLALTAAAPAVVPQKLPSGHYSKLYLDSPFTIRKAEEAAALVNPLEDYALIGVSPIGKIAGQDGYRVTLLNKKRPDERITVASGEAKSDFRILEVIKKSGDPLGTIVRMSAGSMTGTVAFDEKLLVLAIAQPTAPNQPGNPGMPQNPNGMPMPPGVSEPPVQRQARPRVVPPPVPQPPPQPGGAPNAANLQAPRQQRRN